MDSAVGLVLLLGPIAIWATPTADLRGKDRADAINATRQTLLAAAGGIVLLIGAAFTARTYHLSRRGQLTDRYTKAMALLASDKITERLGGVYALEHLMRESQRDHATVIEVLAAFIREQTTTSSAGSGAWNAEHRHEGDDDQPRVATDVQAALTVIGRRPQRPERNPVDLSLADLCGADLSGLNLDHVSLWRTKLRSAIMLDTQLKGANLCWAQLQDAGLTDARLQNAALAGAQLQKAVLMGAQLQHAELENTNLQGAHLAEADLHGAILDGAQLQGADFVAYPTGKPAQPARGLTAKQLASAAIDDATRLPADLRDRLPSTTPPTSIEQNQQDGPAQTQRPDQIQ
jgi:uncharacterized protein YjbI with pentapeptide repeats